MSQRPKDLSALFEAAVEIESEQERLDFVNRSCGQDADLRAQLEILLNAHAKAGNFLSTPPPELAATQFGSSEQICGESASSPQQSVLHLIEKTVDGELPRVVLDSSPDELAGPIVRPKSSEVPKHEVDSRYQLQGEIARGGMGAILKGRDTDLGRDLAVKVLLDEHKQKADIIQRFVEEAQIGGQLQHPGIVPVYELGQFIDQRPFFTMKLVKGKTLSALLEERESPEADRTKFLGIFGQICLTMAYAHSRGVIHRDLKPSNVMVGAFGEVQVMDWGLAKVLAEGGVADEKKAFDNRTKTSIIQTIRSLGSDTPAAIGSGSHGSHTQIGSVLGTPAYMPPEQALGEIDRLDQRSDVFGLGAILAEILTGSPPYTGQDHIEVFRKASRAKLDDCYMRLEAQSLDKELVQIVQDALQPEPEDRTRDAGVLSERISRHLASLETRVRAAELAKVEADTRATEESKRRKVVMALAASVLLTMGLAGGGYLYVKRQRAELATTQARQEREEETRRLQRESQIASELSTARALTRLDVEADHLPNRDAVERAIAAIDRVDTLLGTNAIEDSLREAVQAERDRLTNLKRDHDLIVGLENAWQEELEFRAEQQRRVEEQRTSDNANNSRELSGISSADGSNSEIVLELSDHDPIWAYEKAFADWGLTTEIPFDDAIRRLKSVHSSLRPWVFTSLDRWRDLLAEPNTIERWQQADWELLDAVELKAREGDKLEELGDRSILASGANAWAGYNMVFDTNVKRLSALRLEALLHPSLPNHGPGRLPGTGHFLFHSLNGLGENSVDIAPLDDLSSRRKLVVKRAVADYVWWRAPMVLGHCAWNTSLSGGRPHVAVFELDQPVQSDVGFRIWISSGDRPRQDRYSSQRLGRFRWSASDGSGLRRSAEHVRRLSRLIEESDPDDWRRETRLELGDGDLTALVSRTRNKKEIGAQSNPVVGYLSSRLNNFGPELLMADTTNVSWQTINDATVESLNGTTLEQLDDGSILASGVNPLNETISITSWLDLRSLTAVRLELILHDDGKRPQPNFGRIGNSYLAEFEVATGPDFEPAHIERGLNAAYGSDLLSDAIDGNPSTYAALWAGEVSVRIVFYLSPQQLSGRVPVRFRLLTGVGSGANLQRFRISVTGDDLASAHVGSAARSLLESAVERDPTDYWSRLALAAALQNEQPPKLEQAMRQAIAAIALRPDHSGGHAAVLRSINTNRLHTEPELAQLARSHIKQLLSMDERHPAVRSLVYALIKEAGRRADQRETQLSLEMYQRVLLLQPNDAQLHSKVAYQLVVSLNELDAAIEAYLRAIELEPSMRLAYNNLGSCYSRRGDEEKAIEMYRKAIELFPDSVGVAYSNLASHLGDQGNYEEAIEICRKGIDVDPHAGQIRSELGRLLLKTGKPDEAERAYRNAVDASPNELAVYNSLAFFLQSRGKVEEAIEVAEKGVQLSPQDAEAHNSLGIVHYRSEQFEEAAAAYRKAIELAPTALAYHTNLASCLIKLGNVVEALEVRKRATELRPNNANSLNNFAWALVTDEDPELWDPTLAVELAEKALELDPAHSLALNTLGVAYYRKGKWLKSIEKLNESLAASNGTSGSSDYFFLAMANWQLGEKQEARDWLDQAKVWMNDNSPQNDELLRFRNEAEALIRAESPPQPRS